MSKELIQSELNKETPDYLFISNIAKELYQKSLPSNPLKFKKGMVNIIKCGEYSTWEVKKELERCFEGDEYFIVNCGTSGMNKLIKLGKSKGNILSDINDMFVIIVTSDAPVVTNTITAGFPCNLYKASIYNKYSNKDTRIIIKGEGVDVRCKVGELKSYIRDYTLNSILD